MYQQSGKNLLNTDTSSTRPHNMVNFGVLMAEICWWVWGTPANFNRFHVTARHSSSGRQPNCGVEQTAPPAFGRTAIPLGIGPHSSFQLFSSSSTGSPLNIASTSTLFIPLILPIYIQSCMLITHLFSQVVKYQSALCSICSHFIQCPQLQHCSS